MVRVQELRHAPQEAVNIICQYQADSNEGKQVSLNNPNVISRSVCELVTMAALRLMRHWGWKSREGL